MPEVDGSVSDTSNSLDAADELAPRGERAEASSGSPEQKTAVFASWNIFSAKNYDGDGGHFNRTGFEASIRRVDADVVGLQEVDNGMVRTRWRNLARLAAEAGGYDGRFAPVRRRLDLGLYGNALLTRPSVEVLAFENVRLPRHGWNERRNAVVASLSIDGFTWNVANTHLSNIKDESREQLGWLLDYMDASHPCVVMGDMNRDEDEIAEVLAPRRDWSTVETPCTWSSTDPRKRIDWMIVRDARAGDCRVESLEVSDHRCLVVTLTAGA